MQNKIWKGAQETNRSVHLFYVNQSINQSISEPVRPPVNQLVSLPKAWIGDLVIEIDFVCAISCYFLGSVENSIIIIIITIIIIIIIEYNDESEWVAQSLSKRCEVQRYEVL